ncbi:MAG: response regulator [Cyclobacteriaceae bacterium]|nr:response regulator [Cyclobacteriaceae bacterium]
MNEPRYYHQIILIDDDEFCHQIAKKFLGKIGIHENILTFFNGRQALDHIKLLNLPESGNDPEGSKTLILLDINMPILNGFEFLEELLATLPDMRKHFDIHILTSSSNQRDIENAERYNLEGYIVKPLSIDKLKTLTKPRA